MNKQLMKRIFVAASTVSMIVLVIFFAYRFYKNQETFLESSYYKMFVSDIGRQPNPNFLSDYPENKTGSYQFDPKTIFVSLEHGKDVFVAEQPHHANDKYEGIIWTQFDFLHIANALSQKVWNEPLDLDSWSVYNIIFGGNCNDNFGGFNFFDITYYKTIKTDWKMIYTTRHITLTPWMGTADWAGDGEFSAPFIFSWENIELTKFKTTSEQAVRIAGENGGKTVWANNNHNCDVTINIDKNVNRNTDGNWHIDFYNNETGATFNALIDPFNEGVHSRK